MNRLTLAVSAAALALTGAAHAASGAAPDAAPAGPGGMMGKTITRAEAQAMAGAMFDKLDANKDGKLDKTDREARMAQRFKALDTDGNGQLSLAEFAAAHDRAKGPGARGPGMAPGEGPHRMGMRGMGRGGMMMARMTDTNKDGVITREEFTAAHLKHFDRMDANKDGSVTPEERKAAMARMRGGMKGEIGGKRWRGGTGADGDMGGMPMGDGPMGDGPPPPPPGN